MTTLRSARPVRTSWRVPKRESSPASARWSGSPLTHFEEHTMMPPIDLTDPALDPVPIEDRETLIEYATRKVMQALTHARYETDEDGVPTDTTVRMRLTYAVIEQALTWHQWGINPATASTDRAVQSHSLGPATVTYDHRDGHAEKQAQVRDEIAPAALAWIRPILHQPAY